MSENRCSLILEVAELLEEPCQLQEDLKQLLRVRVEVLRVLLDRFRVLDHRVKPLLLEDLPVAAELVFILRREHHEEVLEEGNRLLEPKEAFRMEEVVSHLLDLPCRFHLLLDGVSTLHMNPLHLNNLHLGVGPEDRILDVLVDDDIVLLRFNDVVLEDVQDDVPDFYRD